MTTSKSPASIVRLAPRVFVTSSRPVDDATCAALPPGSLVLPQHPSSAFGDGSHPTTRLCARAVDLMCRTRPIASVLDVGAGTGVLARVARAHGATTVVATDIDDESLRVLPDNAALDDTAVAMQVFDARTHGPDAWGPRFDLVVANILQGVLEQLAPALVAALAPHGVLLLSGFTRAQTPGLRAVFARHGADVTVQADDDEWVVLQLARAREAV